MADIPNFSALEEEDLDPLFDDDESDYEELGLFDCLMEDFSNAKS